MYTDIEYRIITDTFTMLSEITSNDQLYLLRIYFKTDLNKFLEYLDILVNDWLDENDNAYCIPIKLIENIDILNCIMLSKPTLRKRYNREMESVQIILDLCCSGSCPEMTVNPSTETVEIKDDFGGSVKLSTAEFKMACTKYLELEVNKNSKHS